MQNRLIDDHASLHYSAHSVADWLVVIESMGGCVAMEQKPGMFL